MALCRVAALDSRTLLRSMVADVVFERLFRFGTNTPVPPDTVDALFSKPLSTSRDLGSALSGSNPSSTLSARLSVRRSVHPSGLERRKIIARCRVLRADIRQFEEDFEKRLGRKPHGVERQQKHHVYMEYRQLKGVIRENAVLHIQAVWRGCAARRRVAAETGGMLPRPRATKREVASSSKQGSPRVPALSSPSLSQPGASSTLTSPTLPVAGAMSYAFAASSSNTAAAGTSAPSKPSVAVVSSTTPSASVAAAAASAPSAHGPLVPPIALSSISSAPSASTPPVSVVDKLRALKQEKSDLKAELRAFDAKFAAEMGRNPTKPEKEHLRPRYQRYHDLKEMITTLEGAIALNSKSARVLGSSSPLATDASTARSATSTSSLLAVPASVPVGVSTTSSSGRGMGTTSASRSAESALPSVEHSVRAHGVNASASGAPDFLTADSSPTRRSGSVLSGFSEMSSMTDLVSGLGTLSTSVPTAAMGHALYPHPSSFAVTTPDSGSVTPTNATISAEALRQLKFEKRQLQHTLRQFEREFEEREGRKVKFPKDIAPVAEQYARYKQIKVTLQELEPQSAA